MNPIAVVPHVWTVSRSEKKSRFRLFNRVASVARAGLALLLAPLAVVDATGAVSKDAFPGLSRKWMYYQSPNFELYSARSDEISRDILEQMELLRAIFLDTFKFPVRLPQPVTIFSFASEADFNGYVSNSRKGAKYEGFCLSQADRTVITLAPAWSPGGGSDVVFHEYIHVLFHIAEKNPPPWFNEGVAELFSTIDAQKKWVTFGNVIPGRVAELRSTPLMPFERLFAIRGDDPIWRNDAQVSMLYSQSWILLHYLQFGEHKIPPEKVLLFMKVAETDAAQEKPERFRLFAREALGEDYAGLARSINSYLRSGTFMGRRMSRPAIPAKASYSARPAPPQEMADRLAELALRFTDNPSAKLAILNRLSEQPDPRLNEVLAANALGERDDRVARERLRAALEQGSKNVAVYRELARLEADQVFNRFDLDYMMPVARADELRRLLLQSIEAAPEQSAGYELLAWVEASVAAPSIVNVNRVQKRFETLNDKPRTLLALAVVRLKLGDKAAAADLLAQMDRLQPPDWILYNVELARARIEGRPVDPAKLPNVAVREGTTVILEPPRFDPPH